MNLNLSERELEGLESVWQSQAPSQSPPLDFTTKHMPQGWSLPVDRVPGPEEMARSLKQALGWPEWVRLYPKAIHAMHAAGALAKEQGFAGGVVWLAPGTGSPLHPPSGSPGLAVLRADWAPNRESLLNDVTDVKALGVPLVLDENICALRLTQAGARQFYGLEAPLSVYGPSLAGGRDLGVLAGIGQAPPQPKKDPSPISLAALAGTLAKTVQMDIPARMTAWGRALRAGMEFYKQQAGLDDEIRLEGPLPLPRLAGSRLWAFLELAREEGLDLNPLVLFDPDADPELAPQSLWPRLARSAARLKVLPKGEKAPASWPSAYAAACGKKE